MKNKKLARTSLIDISQPLNETTAEWPGDQSFSREWTARIEEGSNITLGAFCMSAHLGTHADAPAHYSEEGGTSETLPLAAFWGPAQVVEIKADAIRPEHVVDLEVEAAPRLLFKTHHGTADYRQWSGNFPPVLPETIEYLADAGAVLIGTDAPSVDPADSQALPAHHALAHCNVVNLENLFLSNVQPGGYELSALPLRLDGMDAAPVRAVLRT